MKKNRKRKIINRNIVMLVIVFVAVMAVLIHSYAEESNVSQEEIESSDTIHNVDYSYTSDNKKYYQTFEYQDEMLAADSGTLSTDLAKVTVGLATAAYDEREITACLSSMNYTLVASKTFNYDGVRKATYEDNDFVAFSIGYKKVSLNGETYNAYVVPIRGTTGNDEWLSNFKLGAAGDSYHYGFKKAADGVLSTLRSKIKTKNNIFLITGHSRGAAVANIVAGELTIDKDLASADHIFGYTYACPAVKIGADTTLDNVININNPGDAIPELPLADWGYQRYGKSLSLSTDKKFYDNLKVQYKNALGREYAGILNTDSYVATLKTIAGTRDAYFQPENQMLFELAGWLLGPKTKEMDTLAKILAHYNVNGLIGKSISNILSDITVSGVQTAFDKENQNNKEILITIDGYLEDTVNMNESEFEDWRTSISNTSTFEKLQDEMNIAIRTRSDLVQLRKEVKEEMDSFSYTQSNLETILSLFYTTKGELKNAIFDGHTPLTYVKWINSTYYGWRGWQNNDDVKNMEIENNIKRIDISCFQGCQNLNQVILPDTLEHVRRDAFEGCTGIKELTMPVDLDYVKTSYTNGNPSFYNCGNIEKITYSKGKTGIMPDIKSNKEGVYISYYTAEYYAGKNLTTVEFEEGVKNIGARAYYSYRTSINSGMPNLKNIKLASTVKKIGDYAFCNNKAITDFDFSNIEELGERSFSGCSGLSDLTIPAGLKEMPYFCFYGCTGLSSLKIPETIEKVCGGAFGDCTGIKELTMPVDLDYVKNNSSTNGYSSFFNCGNIEKITYSKGKTGIMPDIESGSTSYDTAECYAGKSLTTVEFEEGVKNIGARAYYFYRNSITSGCVYGMPNLKNIKLASTVKKIGDYAFYKNIEITKFDFSNIEELGESSFSGCRGLSDLTIPAGLKEIPASCFYGCTGLSSLKIPETIEKVCGYAFGDCTGIKELTMPVDLDYVNKSRPSFRDCGNIEKITYSKGKTGIMPDTDNADIDNGSTWYYTAEYYAGNNLTTVEFEEGVKNIGARAYCWHAGAGGSGLKNIKLASTVKKIGDDAFYKNTEITKFDFSNIEELGERSFYGCSGLSDLTIPAGMKEIPASCFYGCTSLSSLKISETIEKVCGDAFEDCTGIKELTMPVDLDYVKAYSSTDGYPSFRNCGNIEKITYSKGKTGTMPDIKSGSASYYTAEYYAGKKLTTVEFQSGIEYIGAGSFDQASALKNIVLPCTVSAISSKTFCAINKSEAVIYGTKDTYAEAYAKEQKIPFRGWNDPIITSEEPVAAPEEQVQLVGIAYTGVDEYVNISDWSVKECESKDTHIDENGLLTVGKDEPKGEIVVAACYGNYTETVKVRIVNPTYTVHFVGDITLDAKTDENCNVYCPKEYEEKGYEYQYYLGKDTDSEQIEEKDWPLTVAQDTEIYVKKILKEPSIDKINPTEKEMDFIYDGEKREISISASHEIGEKGVLSYQWYYDEMQDGDFEEIHLATGASISVKDVKDSGVYKCRVTLCDGKDTTWVDSKVVCVNITQRLVPIPILQDSQKNLYYTGVEQKLLFEKLETDWVNITEAAATLPGNYVASVGLKDAENSIWADSTKEAKEYPWKIIGKETTPKPLESPTVTNAPTYEPGNTARPSGAPDENPSKTPEIKPGEVPTESPAATDTPTYEPGNTARPSGAPDENPERTPEIKASEVPTDVPEIKPTIAPDKITTGSQDTDLVFQPEDMTGDSREEALFLEKKVNVKKLQNKKKNKLYISWGKVELPQKAFYQVQISTKRNFKGAKNIYTTKSIYCYKGVKKGKKYYVRVRLGVTRDGKKIYGKWSNLKKKKIKN